MANRKKEHPLVRVTLSLDPQDYKSFEALAEENDRSTAYLVRQAMREFLIRTGNVVNMRDEGGSDA